MAWPPNHHKCKEEKNVPGLIHISAFAFDPQWFYTWHNVSHKLFLTWKVIDDHQVQTNLLWVIITPSRILQQMWQLFFCCDTLLQQAFIFPLAKHPFHWKDRIMIHRSLKWHLIIRIWVHSKMLYPQLGVHTSLSLPKQTLMDSNIQSLFSPDVYLLYTQKRIVRYIFYSRYTWNSQVVSPF